MTKTSESGVLLFLPQFAKLFPNLSGLNRYIDSCKVIEDFINDFVSKKEDNWDVNSEPNDFIEVYLNEIRKTKDPNSSFYGAEGSKFDFIFKLKNYTLKPLSTFFITKQGRI